MDRDGKPAETRIRSLGSRSRASSYSHSTVTPPQIRVWTLDGQRKLDADLGEHLGGDHAAPQIAVTPHAELLVFDPSAPRVFRFRMHLETKEHE